jgi:predicted AAA+ superfamily ATPase
LLQPYHSNFGKRYIKSPKIYFTDTGLACRLLGIGSAREAETHSSIGGLFENYCIAELNKQIVNYDLNLKLWFFRDSHGNEVDIVIEKSDALVPIELKSALGFSSSVLKGIRYWNEATGSEAPGFVIYSGGNDRTGNVRLLNWKDIAKIAKDGGTGT